MEFSTIVCRWCQNDTPEKGYYCMHCGKTPQPLPSQLWKAEKLEIADDADFGPLIDAVLPGRSEGIPPAAVVRWAISRLTDKQSQVLIRLYGLDGKDPRNGPVVSREAGMSDTSVYQHRNNAFRQMRHPRVSKVLLGLRPVPTN